MSPTKYKKKLIQTQKKQKADAAKAKTALAEKAMTESVAKWMQVPIYSALVGAPPTSPPSPVNPAVKTVTVLYGPYHGQAFQIAGDVIHLPMISSAPVQQVPYHTITVQTHEEFGWVALHYEAKSLTPPTLCPACGRSPQSYTLAPSSYVFTMNCPVHGPWKKSMQDMDNFQTLTGKNPIKALDLVQHVNDTSSPKSYLDPWAATPSSLSMKILTNLVKQYYGELPIYGPPSAMLKLLAKESLGDSSPPPRVNAVSVSHESIVKYAIEHGILVPETPDPEPAMNDDADHTVDILELLADEDLYTEAQIAEERERAKALGTAAGKAAGFEKAIDAVLEETDHATANNILDMAFGWIEEVNDVLAETEASPAAAPESEHDPAD